MRYIIRVSFDPRAARALVAVPNVVGSVSRFRSERPWTWSVKHHRNRNGGPNGTGQRRGSVR